MKNSITKEISVTKQEISAIRFGWRPARAAIGLLLAAAALAATPPAGLAHDAIPVIVDTDMALDDARALALLLASPSVRVLAIVTSDGVSSPEAGVTNVSRLLRYLGHAGIPMGTGRTLDAAPSPWRINATSANWTELGDPVVPPGGFRDAVGVIRSGLRSAPDRVRYLCLGPLTNLGDALKAEPELARRIEMVMWYGTPPGAPKAGWNADRDLDALRTVAAAGLTIEALQFPAASAPIFDDDLLGELEKMDAPAAQAIARLHSGERTRQLVRANHLRMWDDFPALRLLQPSLGETVPVAGQSNWLQLTGFDPAAMRRAFLAGLRPVQPRGTVVLAEFPDDPEHLAPDVREWSPRIIERHGLEEWKSAVLTSELHRHLGTYSIVGAKMGLRARERLGADLDELRVESHAGLKPPLSCLNDGLQVATGASLGRGTITVLTPETPQSEALFSHGARRLRLRLKNEIGRRIAADLATLQRRHGGLTRAYFEEVRAVSLRHWLELDRDSIFEEMEESPAEKP
jgi:pyrimidine-specific ribonucleoside hydrolase